MADQLVESLVQEYTENEQQLAMINDQISQQVATLVAAKSDIESRNASMRERIQQAMEEYEVKDFENEFVRFTYIAPTSRKGVNVSKLRALYPKIADELETITPVKASIRIKVK